MDKIIEYLTSYKEIINILSLPLSLIAIILALITLAYTIKTFLMKKGINVKCSYSIASSVECNDKYISDFILENRKDKSIVVFHIYMKIGNNYYLELEDFEDEPLIIKPFEVYRNSFDPILMYSVSSKRIQLDKLFDNNKVKKQILLYTTEGEYTVKAHIKLSNPISLFFKNYSTAVIKPLRLTHNNKSYGENIKYLVDFVSEKNDISTLALRKDSYRHKYNNFILTKEVLTNKKSLEGFFTDLIQNNKLEGLKEVKVYDFEEGIKKRFQNSIIDTDKIIEAKYYGLFKYYVLGKIFTIINNFSMDLKNYLRNNPNGQKIKYLSNKIKMKLK
jgi:hypothetical protein